MKHAGSVEVRTVQKEGRGTLTRHGLENVACNTVAIILQKKTRGSRARVMHWVSLGLGHRELHEAEHQDVAGPRCCVDVRFSKRPARPPSPDLRKKEGSRTRVQVNRGPQQACPRGDHLTPMAKIDIVCFSRPVGPGTVAALRAQRRSLSKSCRDICVTLTHHGGSLRGCVTPGRRSSSFLELQTVACNPQRVSRRHDALQYESARDYCSAQ